MRLAYTTTFDALNVRNWSGTPYYMSQAFAQQNTTVAYIGSLTRQLPPLFKLKQLFRELICQQRESPRFNITAAKYYSQQAAKQLSQLSVDAIVSPQINPIAYLDCKQPIVLWTDAVYAALIGFYPAFSRHSANTIQQGNTIFSEGLSRCRLAIFSSDWAAASALALYGAAKEKVKVVPFGANIDSFPSREEIQQHVKNRARDKIKLLFLAKSWERKGGDTVLAVAQALHAAGHPVELSIVGYQPPVQQPLPAYVKCLGFISKRTAEGKKQLDDLLCATHFLFVPSSAEAYGIVFCEANAFAIPCLTSYVGGISTIVKDGINGMTFALGAEIPAYCEYIVNTWQDEKGYNELALSAYNEYVTRLNWQAAIREVKQLIGEVL
ncbi:MAG TPA: glycosyltransferase family 4 protein [Gammaproteobacteria bacterium]|jgi:glycosyltransferase involved in cell wall biosynthesis|nr:glycosyltransferase family 4 protein [Gammaproteobacteria bacterium]